MQNGYWDSESSVTLWLCVSATQSSKVVLPDHILGCLSSIMFGELLELAESLPDAMVVWAEVATVSSFRNCKA